MAVFVAADPCLVLLFDQALVGNLPYSIQDVDVANFFSDCGHVTDIYLVRDRETGDMRVKLIFVTSYGFFRHFNNVKTNSFLVIKMGVSIIPGIHLTKRCF